MTTTANKSVTKPAPKPASKAPAPAATPTPTVATLAACTAGLGPKCTAAAVDVAEGTLCTAPLPGGGTVAFVAPCTAPLAVAPRSAAWPPLYSGGAGSTTAAPTNNRTGKGVATTSHTVHAVCCPTGGEPYLGTVHVYPNHSANTASSPGTGTMVAMVAPQGATVGGTPPAKLTTWAKANGMGAK